MEFGLGMMCDPGCWEDAVFAEQHGFSTAGFVDSPTLSGDQFVSMAMAAAATTTLRVGTLINVPGLRHAATTASALATVNSIAPGRVWLGTGTGYTGRLALGYRNQVAAEKAAEYVRQVRALLAGDETTHRIGQRDVPITTRWNEDLRPENDRIPVYFAADGPKAWQAAGEVADGLITVLIPSYMMRNGPEAFATAISAVQDAARVEGRDLTDAYNILNGAMCVLEPGESAVSPRALEIAGPQAMIAFHSYACNPQIRDFLPPFVQERIEIYEREVLARFNVAEDRIHLEVHAGHLTRLLEGEAGVLTEDIVRATTWTGTAEEIADKLRAMEKAGLKNATFWAPRGGNRELVTTVAEKIMPLMAPASAPV